MLVVVAVRSVIPRDSIDSVDLFFFFQAEDGIRDHCVTGVQTCALPICAQPPTGSGLAAERPVPAVYRGALSRPCAAGGHALGMRSLPPTVRRCRCPCPALRLRRPAALLRPRSGGTST